MVDRVGRRGHAQRAGVTIDYLVGTMIELPRAALLADEIAESAEFFSFGTNDLTQTTFGLSRDDAGKLPGAYQSSRASSRTTRSSRLDIEGVGELVQHRRRARPRDAARPQARHLRRAWRRPGLDPLLPRGRARLRLLLALPRADRPPGRGAGRAGGRIGRQHGVENFYRTRILISLPHRGRESAS